MNFRSFAATALSAVAFSLSLSVASAADFPRKPVTLVVPWPAGGGSDILMRLIAQKATDELGQPVVVVNQPGAGGSLALREVAEGDKSGHTFAMIATGFIAEQYGNPNAPTLDQFKILALVGTDPAILAARADTGIKTLEELVAKAKQAPGTLRNANDQPGGTSYVAASLMKAQLGIDFTLVPYAGSAPVVQAILAGEVQTATPSVTDLLAQHKSGDVTILAVAGSERHFMAPDIPTFTEQGYPLVTGTIRALVAPADVDPDAAAVLEKALMAALSDESFLKIAREAGFIINPMGTADATAFMENVDSEMYPVLLDAGLVKVRQK
jgi:tripartite-type tricarboxylate transporter receptor subunit TctC